MANRIDSASGVIVGQVGELYFRPAQQDELAIIMQLLKDAALWLREKQIDYWQNWLDPPIGFIRWIQEGFENNEFYMICQADRAIGCFRLQWTDENFWGYRDDASGYIHSFTIARHLAGQHIGKRALALIEDFCRQQGKTYLRLDCGSNVVNLCRYYEEYGFRSAGEKKIQGGILTLYEKKIL